MTLHNGLKARLTTFDATMIVVSLVIGIGIFRTPAIVASTTGSSILFFTAWALGGVISLLGALTFAEIGSRFPRPGAFYRVVAECYHPSVAFMLNWTNILIVNGAGIAAIAIIGAEYLIPILLPPEMNTPTAVQVSAVMMTLILLFLNYLGIKTGARAQNILTIIKIVMMGFIILAAAMHGRALSTTVLPTIETQPLVLALGAGLISVFYTYGGYQTTINFGGDIRGAERNIPKAIFIGIGIIIVLYMLMNAAYVWVLGIEQVAGAKLVAADVARASFGHSGHLIVSLAIFLSAAGFLNVTLMQMPRLYYAMADEGTLPRIFRRVNDRTQAQEFALLFLGGTILVGILFLGTFERLMNYVMLFDSLNNAAVASTIFVLRWRARGSTEFDGYRVPLYPFIPALFILFLLGITVNVMISQPGSILPGLIILALGFPMFLLLRRFAGRTSSS